MPDFLVVVDDAHPLESHEARIGVGVDHLRGHFSAGHLIGHFGNYNCNDVAKKVKVSNFCTYFDVHVRT
jgi:hypothetical protein